ncbi:MAG: thioredoxin domain-containing protein [Methanothrix sp.]|nr:thioredoxin domain-containing protein [Methanothrix sp.]
MDELDEIKKKKMEKMMKDMNKPTAPSIELPDKPVIVTDATIESMASAYPLFILDCWAEWCGPCRMIGPIIEQLAAEMKGQAVFGKLNVDQNMQTANKYRISWWAPIPSRRLRQSCKSISEALQPPAPESNNNIFV